MIILGNTYFWKFLTTCDSAFLDESAEELRSALSEVMGEEFALEQPGSSNREIIRRWSQGCFNEVGEQNLVFPRVCLVYRPLSRERDEHWIADIFFTRAPHIRGLYSNRSNNHVLTPAVEQELSARLINSYLADVFVRKSDNAFVGTAAGLYVYQKIHHIALLKNRSTRLQGLTSKTCWSHCRLCCQKANHPLLSSSFQRSVRRFGAFWRHAIVAF